jgi:sugar/nucleoside kinase (ribokinase family)
MSESDQRSHAGDGHRDLDVVVIGEMNVDIVVTGVQVPLDFGAERLVDDVTLTAGSSGVLTTTGLADLGLRVGFCGLIGDDPFGHYMIEHCERHGIDHTGVIVDPNERTGATVSLSTHIDRAMLTHPGSMAHLTYDHIRFDVLARARHLHLSSHFLNAGLQPDVPRLLARAQAMGLTTSADTGHDPADRWEIGDLLAGLEVFLPNEVEALAITRTTTPREALEALARRVPTVVVKCGANGALAARGAERVALPGHRVTVVDTTGAGDAFDAGFLSGWLAGADLETCVRRGNACGALTAAHVGGSGALSVAQLSAMLADHLPA